MAPEKHLNFRRCQCTPLVLVSFLPRLWCPLWSTRTRNGTLCRSDTWRWEVSVAGMSGALEQPMTFQIDNINSGNRSFFLYVFLSLRSFFWVWYRKLMENLTWSMMVHGLGTTDYTVWCDTVLGHQSQVFFPANCCTDSLRNPYAYANPYGVPYWRWRFHYFWCSKWLESSHEERGHFEKREFSVKFCSARHRSKGTGKGWTWINPASSRIVYKPIGQGFHQHWWVNQADVSQLIVTCLTRGPRKKYATSGNGDSRVETLNSLAFIPHCL